MSPRLKHRRQKVLRGQESSVLLLLEVTDQVDVKQVDVLGVEELVGVGHLGRRAV